MLMKQERSESMVEKGRLVYSTIILIDDLAHDGVIVDDGAESKVQFRDFL